MFVVLTIKCEVFSGMLVVVVVDSSVLVVVDSEDRKGAGIVVADTTAPLLPIVFFGTVDKDQQALATVSVTKPPKAAHELRFPLVIGPNVTSHGTTRGLSAHAADRPFWSTAQAEARPWGGLAGCGEPATGDLRCLDDPYPQC
jgi:hypothetical protein